MTGPEIDLEAKEDDELLHGTRAAQVLENEAFIGAVDALKARYVELSIEAAKARPDLIVWTETAIPWLLAEGEDWLEACLKITFPTGAAHLVGLRRWS